MSLWKPLALIAVSFALVAGLYYGVQSYFGGLLGGRDDRPTRAPAWPAPPRGTPPHPLWGTLDRLWRTSSEARARETVLARLLELAPDALPHPSRMPASWPPGARARVRALLVRLRTGRPYRAQGLELRLSVDRRPVAGRPADVRVGLACGSDGGRWARRVAPDLAARLVIRASDGFRPAEPAPDPAAAPALADAFPAPAGCDVGVPAPALAGGVFARPGRGALVVAVDLTDRPGAPTRWGPGPHFLISNRLVVDVAAADAPVSPSPAGRSSR